MRMILLTLVILGVTFSTVQSGTSPRIICYFASGAVSRPGKGRYGIEDIPVDQCTHIIYSFIGVTNDTNEVLVLNPKVDEDQNGFRNFTSLRSKYPDTKFVVALGGWAEGGSKYSVMASQNSSRAHFIQSVIDFLEKYQFDGLDLNWQYPGATDRNGTAADKNNFLYLVQELKEAFSKAEKNWELTAGVPLTKEKVAAGYRVSELCQVLDAIYLMSYDLRSVWNSKADELHNNSNTLPSFEKINMNDGLSLWEEKGCPRQKLVMGIPFHGRSFTLPEANNKYDMGTKINQVAGDGNPGPYTNEKGFLAYYEICSKLEKRKSKWTKKWDKNGKCPYAYKENQWISYDDPKSIKINMNTIKKKGYLGAVIWSIDMDDFRGLCGKKNPLISLINKQMKTYTVPIFTNSTAITGVPQTEYDNLHLKNLKIKEWKTMQVIKRVKSQLNVTALNETAQISAAVAKQEAKRVESQLEDPVLNTTVPTSSAVSPHQSTAMVAKEETKRVESQIENPALNTTVPTSSAASPPRSTTSIAKKEIKKVERKLDDAILNTTVSTSSAASPPPSTVAKQDAVQLPSNNLRSQAACTTKPTLLSLFTINIIVILYSSMSLNYKGWCY